jgi:D-inositol-3-phosphate glycosyltransferase
MVMSEAGGFRELVADHGAGVLVPPGDHEALAAAISNLIADPDARRRLEERAAAAASGPFSWDRIAEQTTAVYEQVLA